MNCMVRFNCCMGYQIGFSLLGFVQHANDVHPDHCGATHLCYIWCLLLYLILCLFTFPFTLMLKWCNGEMIPDGEVMMVRQFCCGDFAISNFRVGANLLLAQISHPGCVLGIFTGMVYLEIVLLRKTIGRLIFLGDIPG